MLEVPDLAGGNPQLQKAMVKIVKAEQRPLDKLDQTKQKIENRLGLVKDFKARATEADDALKPFKTPKDFKELKGLSSHPDILTVGAIDKELASVGTYDVEVMQTANTNSVSTYGFPDRDKSEVGIGYVTFETAMGETKSVWINSENNTLDGLAKTINSAKVGVRALVVNDGSDADEPWRIIMTGEKTGWKNDITWPEFHMLDGDLDLDIDRSREAQSAIVKVNGEPLMADSNKVTEILPGVTFNLREAKPGTKINLEIMPDYEKIEEKAKKMVEKLNAVLSFIQDQNKLDAKSHKDPKKALGGDVTLTSVESRLRTIVQKTESQLEETQVRQLRDLGITFNRGGTLEYDGKKFQSRLETNFEEVVTFFTGMLEDGSVMGGFANEASSLLHGVYRPYDGLATIQEKGADEKLRRLDRDVERATERAQAKVDRSKIQLGKAEAAIQEMQNMGGGIQSLLPRG
jgi:flagellar hook-associated protein 2